MKVAEAGQKAILVDEGQMQVSLVAAFSCCTADPSERIFEKAAAEAQYRRPGWRCIEQRELLPFLVEAEPSLPKCSHLAGESIPCRYSPQRDAREEIAEALRQVNADETR